MSTPMPVFLNGAPKMGNHALWKACELLGIESDGVNHVPWAPVHDSDAPRLFIKRDPRNALVSWSRHYRRSLAESAAEYLPQLSAFEGWLGGAGALVVSFERLVASDAQMREIAAACGVPYVEGAWEDLPNHTRTWTGRLSDYREVWTPEVDAAWRAHNGPEILARWGY